MNNYFLKHNGKNKAYSDQYQLKKHFWGKKGQKTAFFYTFPANKQQKNLNMSADNSEGSTEELFLRFVGSNTENKAILFDEINRELKVFLTKESNDKDATDGVFDLLPTISDTIQEEFEELIGSDSDRKRFVRALFFLIIFSIHYLKSIYKITS